MQKRWMACFLLAFAVQVAAGPGHEEPAEPTDEHAHEGVEGPEMYNNETWSYVFTEEGIFEYHCHPHPWMQARITVIAADGSPAMNHTINIVEPADFEKWTFDPVELTVRVGDNVTWINEGQVMHKVAQTTEEHAEHIAGAGSTVAGDGHDHEHESSFNQTYLWIGGGVLLGLGIAQYVKNKGQ